MNVKNTIISAATMLAIFSTNIQADETDNKDHVWMIKKPSNKYWQAPDESEGKQIRQDQQTFDSQSTDGLKGIEPASASVPSKQTPQPEQVRYPLNIPGEMAGRTVQTPPVSDVVQTRPVPPAPPGPYLSSSFPPDTGASAYYLPGYHRYMEYDSRLNQHPGYPGRPLPYGEPGPYQQYPSGTNDNLNFSNRRDTSEPARSDNYYERPYTYRNHDSARQRPEYTNR